MNKKRIDKKTIKKASLNPLAVGAAGAAAGAAVGAGVAVVATQALKDKKTRQRVDRVVKNAKKQVNKYMETVKDANVEQGKKAIGKVIATTKKNLSNTGSVKKKPGKNKRVSTGRGSSKSSPRPSSHA